MSEGDRQSKGAPTRKAFVAIDLGAESCRVSLLRWPDGEPEIQLVHRIPNGPVVVDDRDCEHLHWPLESILAGVAEGLRKAAALAPEGIQSIAVDGWAVDYVRLNAESKPLHAPFCYRDERNVTSKALADTIIPPEQFFAETGAQPLRINTVYQLLADKAAGSAQGVAGVNGEPAPWLLLPEFILHWLGGRRVAEYTNATHTGLVDIESGDWSPSIFDRLGLDLTSAPPIVAAGTSVGQMNGDLAKLPAFSDTKLLVPACHDTASAIAAIHVDMEHTAYLVSGTWSLIGTVVERPIISAEAQHAGFTNQGAAAGGYLFHTNVNGMWILKQCMDEWNAEGRGMDVADLVQRAGDVSEIPGIIDVDAAPLMLAGSMPQRINAELTKRGLTEIADEPGNEPIFARLIFASLAHRYAIVLKNLEALTGRTFQRITILGGGSRNALLSRLTEEAARLPSFPGEAEGSTLGNFAVQLATFEGKAAPGETAFARQVRDWAGLLGQASKRFVRVEAGR